MNYPIWYLPELGGGTLIALIAIFHVYVSHFAVGGGLYLIYAEKKGLRYHSQPILEFTKTHARFFLLLTMVFGSITGVGIWFIIALVNPAATSFLIHNFVFGWAAEWVFFTVEIAAAFVYFYMFGKMDSSTHLKVGWLYFIAAWMSLFLINGIIGVMLTPGSWPENLNFWVGFFNPSFFPSLVFRTCIAIMIAALYGFFSASFARSEEVKNEMTRFSAKWALAGLLLAVPSGYWYLTVLPEAAYNLVMGKSPTISTMVAWGMSGLIVLLAIILIAGLLKPVLNYKPIACLTLLAGLVVMGSFEWVREAARRPYVLNEVMYSNSILKKDVEHLNHEGYLKSARWVEQREVDDHNSIKAGKEIFVHQCYACHTVGGGNNDIIAGTENMSYRALTKYIERIHETRYFMPPFAGTEEERHALAAYIAGHLHGKEVSVDSGQAVLSGFEAGRAVFEESCSACHGVEEMESGFEGVAAAEINSTLLTLDELSDEMEPFDGTEDERKVLVTFLSGLGNPDTLGVVSEIPVSPSGEILFEDNCSACHSSEEAGEVVGGRTIEELKSMLNTLDELSDEMEPFSGTEEEQSELAKYLEKLSKGDE